MSAVFPNQPGYLIYHDPTVVHYPKKSHVYQEKELFKEIKPPRDFKLPNQTKPDDPVMKVGSSYSQSIFQNPYGNNVQEQYNPDFVKLDKMVLRFYGYFKESVEENELENARIRLLVIFYYLQDDTISVIDTKQENSGIPQGAFLNRGKVRKSNDDYYTYKDFEVGKDVVFYGKIIRLYDCDIYTRQFYAENGVTQPPRQEHPMDPFLIKLTTKPVLQKDHLMKDYLEYSMGGGKVKPAKQFLENDRKVLRFNATFEGLKYIIHYYLSDDTVEIREVNYTNSGRDPFPLLLKRNRLPRKFCVPQPGEVGQFDFYTDADIEPFMTLWAFNRPFKILGCDEFTAEYYLKNYRRNFPVGGFEDPPQKSKSGIVIPPYNGYGSEEDSLGNCLRLLNKPPKKDYYKYIDNDRTILRFLAKLNTKVMEDVDRRFLISFFLCDDSIQVYEMANRNSGIWEGKFLERGQYKNVENENKKFTISDFEIGKSMRINTFSFHVLDADEFTKKWIAENFS